MTAVAVKKDNLKTIVDSYIAVNKDVYHNVKFTDAVLDIVHSMALCCYAVKRAEDLPGLKLEDLSLHAEAEKHVHIAESCIQCKHTERKNCSHPLFKAVNVFGDTFKSKLAMAYTNDSLLVKDASSVMLLHFD